MSLHLNQQCQRAKNTDARSYPLLPGLAGHPCFLRPPQVPVWRPAAVRWPICSTPIRVNILFALLLQSAEKMAEICASQQVWTGFSPPIRPFLRAISASKYGGFQRPGTRQKRCLWSRSVGDFAGNMVAGITSSPSQARRSTPESARLPRQIRVHIINDSRAHATPSPFAGQLRRDSHTRNGTPLWSGMAPGLVARSATL
jgi:hypothetical protein